MKIKLRKEVYIPISPELFTCGDCIFLSDNKGLCNAPKSIYKYCLDHNQFFHHSQRIFKIFDL